MRVMIDLAEHYRDGYIPMKIIAERQGISLKYLEQILPSLTKNGMIEGLQRKGGGYKLTAGPDEYRVGNILRVTEGNLAPALTVAQKCANAPETVKRCQCGKSSIE